MNFSQQFSQHIQQLNCSLRSLSETCGLSEPVLSRYKSGTREPNVDSPQFHQLLHGIAKIAEEQGCPEMTYPDLLSIYTKLLTLELQQKKDFCTNFKLLLNTLSINVKALSQDLNFEASYLYRIKKGERYPSDLEEFTSKIACYAANHYQDSNTKTLFSSLANTTEDTIASQKLYEERIFSFLLSQSQTTQLESVAGFLNKLDQFNLDDYIKTIHFDDIKTPTLPFQLPANNTYYGVEHMRTAELDFFKTTVLSKNVHTIFMHSTMPMEKAAEDMEFNKKWMFGIAASLKKGHQINIIHSLDRPFAELMLGLEAWIPIYMTGQVHPYYLPKESNETFQQLLYVSEAATLTGECIRNHYESGRYVLSNAKSDIAYYKTRAAHLLESAKPLFAIYDQQHENEFLQFLQKQKGLTKEMLNNDTFQNITIEAINHQMIVISKQASPKIHFVIQHPTLVQSIYEFMKKPSR